MNSYIGVNNQSKEVQKVYVGIGGKAKNVWKAYIGTAGNVPKLFFWGQRMIDKPQISGTYTYNGTSQEVTITGVDEGVDVTGETEKTNAGTYTVYYTLTDPQHTTWRDGTTGTKSDTWTIQQQKVNVPTYTGSLTYNKKEQNVTSSLTGYDSSIMSLRTDVGQIKATHAGNYTAYVTLTNPNYMWQSGSTGSAPISWNIAQAPAPEITWDAGSGSTEIVISSSSSNPVTARATIKPTRSQTDAYTGIEVTDIGVSSSVPNLMYSFPYVYWSYAQTLEVGTETSGTTDKVTLTRSEALAARNRDVRGYIDFRLLVNDTDYDWSGSGTMFTIPWRLIAAV